MNILCNYISGCIIQIKYNMRISIVVALVFLGIRAAAQTNATGNSIKPLITAQGLLDKVWSNDSVFNGFVEKFNLHFLKQLNDTTPGRITLIYGNSGEVNSDNVIVEMDKVIDTIHFSTIDIPMVTMILKTSDYNTYNRLMKEYPKTRHIASAGMEFSTLNMPGLPLYSIKVWRSPR